jgi:RNase H-like domain found in reverse transcriptase
VEAILKIKAPTTRKELRHFIGIVDYYRDMWFRRCELLAPLTILTSSKVKFEWLPTHQLAFDKIKKVIETEVLLSYPEFVKPFHIYTDASDHQLGAVIMQDKKPLAFYSRKLMQPKEDTPPRNVSCYLLLKHASNIRTSCWVILS